MNQHPILNATANIAFTKGLFKTKSGRLVQGRLVRDVVNVAWNLFTDQPEMLARLINRDFDEPVHDKIKEAAGSEIKALLYQSGKLKDEAREILGDIVSIAAGSQQVLDVDTEHYERQSQAMGKQHNKIFRHGKMKTRNNKNVEKGLASNVIEVLRRFNFAGERAKGQETCSELGFKNIDGDMFYTAVQKTLADLYRGTITYTGVVKKHANYDASASSIEAVPSLSDVAHQLLLAACLTDYQRSIFTPRKLSKELAMVIQDSITHSLWGGDRENEGEIYTVTAIHYDSEFSEKAENVGVIAACDRRTGEYIIQPPA